MLLISFYTPLKASENLWFWGERVAWNGLMIKVSEADLYRGSYRKVFWKYAANLQNTHTEMWFQKSCKSTLLKLHFAMGFLL